MTIDFGEYGVSVNDAALLQEFGLEHLTLTKRGDLVTVNKIVTAERDKGNGTRFMEALASLADAQGWTLALTPDLSLGATSIARLRRFYKRFGFKENKGRYTDFTISESMVRRPETHTR